MNQPIRTNGNNGTTGDPPPKYTYRQVFYATIVVAAITISFYLLFRYSQIVFVLFLAIVISTAIRPLVNRLNRIGVPRSLGVILVYLMIVVFIIGVIAMATPLVTSQISAISNLIPQYYGTVRSTLFLSQNLILQRIALNLPEQITLLPASGPTQGVAGTTPVTPATAPTQSLTPQTTQPLNDTYSSVGLFGLTLLALASIFVLGFYWTLERDRTIRNLLLWVSINRREAVRDIIDEMEDKVGRYIVGQGIVCATVGGMALIAYTIIGLPYVLVIGILAGITEAIPVFGPILGAVVPLIIALATNPSKAIWVVAAAIFIQMTENYLLVPRIMDRSVGVNSTFLLLTFLALSLLFGLPGAVVSVPLAAILQLLVNRLLLTPNLTRTPETGLGRDQISLFRLEAQTLTNDIRKQLIINDDGKEEPADEETIDNLEAISIDLDSLLSQFNQKEGAA